MDRSLGSVIAPALSRAKFETMGFSVTRSRSERFRSLLFVRTTRPLVVKHELADRLRDLVTLPLALEPSCALALAVRRVGTYGLDGIGGRTELVRGDVWHGPGLASGVGGMTCCPTQVSGRGHRMTARRASLGHLDLATYPGTGMLDGQTRSWVVRLNRLEQVQDVLRARCRPKSQEMVVGVGEGPAAADRHEARVSDLWEDHGWHPFCRHSVRR